MRRIYCRGAIGVGILTLFVACQSSQVDWSRAGATDADFQRDWQQCGALASGLNPPVFDARTMNAPPSTQGLADVAPGSRRWLTIAP
jgi:hypothetical protein